MQSTDMRTMTQGRDTYRILFNLQRTSVWCFTALLSSLLICLISGVLIGTYEWDEMYFLHAGWSDYNQIRVYALATGLYEYIIKMSWSLIGGDISAAWVFRAILFFLVVAQGVIVYRITALTFSTTSDYRKHIQVVASLVFITTMTAFRGYEFRPEIIANTCFLYGAYVIFRLLSLERLNISDWVEVLFGGLALVIASAVSMRHVLPAGVFLVVLGLFSSKTNSYKIWLTVLAVIIIGFGLYLHIFEFNIFNRIASASDFQAAREPFPLMRRLSIGGGPFHLFHLILFVVGWVCALVFMFLLFLRSHAYQEQKVIFIVLAAFLCYLSYLAFLIFFDIRPYEYVRSLEWLILVIGYISIIQLVNTQPLVSKYTKPFVVLMTCSLLAISYDALITLKAYKPTWAIVSGLFHSTPVGEFSDMPDDKLVRLIVGHRSILDQVRSRSEYCARHPNDISVVYDFRDHPICMPDDSGRLEMSVRAFEKKDFDASKYRFISLPDIDKRDLQDFGLIKIHGLDGRNLWIKDK